MEIADTEQILMAEPDVPGPDARVRIQIMSIDLFVAFIYAAILISLSLTLASGLSSVVTGAGFAMFLFVPGYALLSMIFPDVKTDDWFGRIVLSIGLSTFITFLIKLLLAIANFNFSLVVILSALSIPCLIIAYARRRIRGTMISPFTNLSKISPGVYLKHFLRPDRRTERLATVVLTIILSSLIITAIIIMIIPKQGEKYTGFYILGNGGKATDYPMEFRLGEEKPVIIGIVNHEYRNVDYDLIIALNDSDNVTQLYSDHFTIVDNQTFEKTVMIKPDHAGKNMNVEFYLYADNIMSLPYRNLNLFVTVT